MGRRGAAPLAVALVVTLATACGGDGTPEQADLDGRVQALVTG